MKVRVKVNTSFNLCPRHLTFYVSLTVNNNDNKLVLTILFIKSRDITLLTNVHRLKAVVFPVVRYGYVSWTIKKESSEELTLLNCDVGEDS